MRVALVNKYWYLKGGAERVVFDTKEILESHGHEVSCFGMEHPKNLFNNEFFVPHIEYSELGGIQKLQAGVASIYNRKTKQAFGKFLDAYAPEVIHIHNIYHQLSFSILDEAIKRHIPIVMTLHDYKMMSPNYQMYHHGKIDMSMIGGKYYRCLLNNCGENFLRSSIFTAEAYLRKWKKYREKISYFIAPSNWMKAIALKAGIPVSKIATIQNPAHVTKDELTPRKDKGYVLYFGRFTEEKGLKVLLSAAKNTPDIPYYVVGEGPLQKELEVIINTQKTHNVTLRSFQSGDTLMKTIKEARLTVLPSVWHENASMSVVRSITCGKIVVGTNVGGIPEILPASMIVAPNDSQALAEKIAYWYGVSEETRSSTVKKIQKDIIKNHDPNLYYKNLIECYEHTIEHES